MFQITNSRRSSNCEGSSRRDFLRVGTLGLTSLGLPHLLAERSRAAAAGQATKDTAVVWLWLSGGPTHVETFDPKMTAPVEYRSVVGEVTTNVPGINIGGLFERVGKVADRMAFVRSFAHKNSGHGGGTHYVMTGYDNRQSDAGGLPTRPSLGSILARSRGANHPQTGMPTYIGISGINTDGAAFLGTAYAPFKPTGPARTSMDLSLQMDRFDDRRALLAKLDTMQRNVDQSGLMEGLDRFDQQAFGLVLGSAAKAFDINREPAALRERYGKGLGEQMLQARRLCEAGAGFVTINYGGWDMHGSIEASLKRRVPELDRAVAAFVTDCRDRGLADKILLVVTGEFGRTPKINAGAGRDHWAPLSTLALSGGGLKMGQVIGESAAKLDVPKSAPIGPQDLMATVFHVLGLPRELQYVNPAGRPVHMLDNGRAIAELV